MPEINQEILDKMNKILGYLLNKEIHRRRIDDLCNGTMKTDIEYLKDIEKETFEVNKETE